MYLSKAEKDPERKNRLMRRIRGGVSLRPGLSVTWKRWGRDGWEGYVLDGWGKEKRIKIVIRFGSDGERKLRLSGNRK